MMLFFSRNVRPVTVRNYAGDGIEPVFSEKTIDGRLMLVRTGANPINPFVQEGLADTMVYNIIDRYKSGDVNALNRMTAQYMDVTGMPKSLAEAQQRIIDVEKKFAMFPAAVRAKFGNSVNRFVEECATGNVKTVLSDLGFVSSPTAPNPSDLGKMPVEKGDVE